MLKASEICITLCLVMMGVTEHNTQCKYDFYVKQADIYETYFQTLLAKALDGK